VEKGPHVVAETELGQISITSGALAQIVGHTAAESYGVVGQAPTGRWRRLLRRERLTRGIDVNAGEEGLVVDLHVVVEYGLNLAEVAATVRTRVAYELERQTGLRVAAVEVHVDDVRGSA
jgi:uncharacterized alkaline shock family protein YloU